MPFYQRNGKIPSKRHVQFRNQSNNLMWEELVSRNGFSGIYSNLEECTSNCHLNYIDEFYNNPNNKKNIFKIFNLLGQEYKLEPTGVFIIIYENGLAEKKIIFDKQ